VKKKPSTAKLCPISRFLTDSSFVTPTGYYARCFGVNPFDPDGRMPGELATVALRCTDLLRNLHPEVHLYEYSLSLEDFPLATESDLSVAQRRTTFLRQTAGFKSEAIVWCTLVRPQKKPDRTLAILKQAMAAVQNTISVEVMDEHNTGAFWSYLMTLAPELVTRHLISRQNVAQQIASQDIKWSTGGLVIGRQHVRQFAMTGWPVGTRPDLLRAMRKLPGNIILCSEYRRSPSKQTRKRVQTLEGFVGMFKRRFATMLVHAARGKEPDPNASTKAAEKSTDTLGDVLVELDNGKTYGHYSLIGLIHGRDPQALEDLLPQIQQVFSDPSQAKMLVESTLGAHSAYEALLLKPIKNERRRWMRDTHAANLSFAFLPGIGHPRSESLGAEYLVCYQTTERRPWFYDPYTNGLRGLLIVGSPRQGKTMNGNFIIDHETKYGGFTTCYDVGGGYNSTVRSHGGLVTKIGLDGPRFAPFALEQTRENLQAIWLLIRTLLRKGGCTLEPREEEGLRDLIAAVYLLPRDSRLLRHVMLPPHQQQYLAKWITVGDRIGTYAHVFDNAYDDLQLSRLQVFDFEGVANHPDLMEPMLMWLTSRKEVQRCDNRYLHLPKHDLFDELWKQIKDPQMWSFLLGDLKTGGKRLGGVTMLTHHIEDLGEHASLIKNACPHVMFLPTENLDRELYRATWGLNDAKLDEIASLPPHHLCIQTSTDWKHLVLNLDPISFAKYTTSPRDIQRRELLTEEFGHEEAIVRMAAG
jgi:hypothetical protein